MPALFTQIQLADVTGQTSVNVNRVFSELEERGLIERHARETIRFPDWQALCRFADFRPEYLEPSL
jgi:hypothetical protein